MNAPFTSLCPEAATRAAMTDDEFWNHVFAQPEPDEDYRWVMEGPDVWAITCARCGATVEVPEDERHLHERDAFCKDCADECQPADEYGDD